MRKPARFNCKDWNRRQGYWRREGVGVGKMVAICRFERQLHVFCVVIVHQIAVEVVHLDKLEQRQTLIVSPVLGKVRDEGVEFGQLVQFCAGKQVDQEKEGRG